MFYSRNHNLINLGALLLKLNLITKFHFFIINNSEIDSIVQKNFEMTSFFFQSKYCPNHQESMLTYKTLHGTRKYTKSWTIALGFFP